MDNSRVIESLKKACKTETGFLTILRMDHFEMFREIYGEGVGDLLRDECIKVISQVTEEDDIRACLGGNEFVIFCKNLTSKTNLTEMYFYIAKQINKVVEEVVDEEESIHLGMSMGAVRVPDYGTEYKELFFKADSMLGYLNSEGRHSIAFYTKTDSDKEEIESAGAMLVDEPAYNAIRGFLIKHAETYKSSAGEMTISLRFSETIDDPKLITETFGELVKETLRKSDVLYIEDNKIHILLPEMSRQGMLMVAGRIERKNRSEGYGDMIEISMMSRIFGGSGREIPVRLEAVI
ncbi:MAG: diguanylate cyclase [Eubacterium sp.]|nr:diguanylate cyclase [Eubacterium sp.]